LCSTGRAASAPRGMVEVERASQQRSAGIGVRVLVRGAWGFACAAETDDASACAEAALDAARAAAALTPDRVRLCPEEPQRGRWETPVAEDPFAVPLEKKIAALSGPVETMRRDQRIQSAQAHLFFRRVEKRLVTSEGTDVEQAPPHRACGIP